MEKNIILLVVITAIAFFVVGNPITYGIMSKITGLKVKNKKDHMILVAIHSVVMTLLMYAAFEFLIKDKECPACPAKKPCPVSDKKKEQKPAQPPAQPAQPPTQPPAQPPAKPPAQPPAQPPSQPPTQPPVVEGYGSGTCGASASGYGN